MWTLKMHSLRFGRRSLFLPGEKSCQHHYACVTTHVKVRVACLYQPMWQESEIDQCQAASSWHGMWVEMAQCPNGKRLSWNCVCLGSLGGPQPAGALRLSMMFKFPIIRWHIIWTCKHREIQDPDRIIELNFLKLPWDSFWNLNSHSTLNK